jgi:signal transduction histidine kinase
MQVLPQNRGDLYGQLTFASVVVVSFTQFVLSPQISGGFWQLGLTFALGAIYGMIGVLSDSLFFNRSKRLTPVYFALQIALVAAILFVSPLKGYTGIAALPVASQAIFELSWRWALAIGAGLFGLCIAAFGYFFGPHGAVQGMIGYSSAFVFTLAFSFITKRAIVSRDQSDRLRRELECANEKLRAYAAQAEELATTRERNRLAREIHDGVGHYLTAINVQLEAARAILGTSPARAATALESATRLSREALDDVRRSVGTLRADAARPPLVEALQGLARDAGIAVTVHVQGTPRPLSPAAEHALYRTAQEGLTNVSKHARAGSASLLLDYRDSTRVALAIDDDGSNTSPPGNESGHGLRGIRERVDLLGGQVTAGPRPDGGFGLAVEIPT